MNHSNLINMAFGDWTVIGDCERIEGKHSKMLCKCKCGTVRAVDLYSLTHNGTKSCGQCNTYLDEGTHMRCVMKNGASFIFDKQDYPLISKFTWSTARGYIRTLIRGKTVALHRLLMNPQSNMQVDHINHDKTDNRRCNLRLASHAENQRNRGIRSNNSTGYKGVCYVARDDNYVAYINVDGCRSYLGTFKTAQEAANAYDSAAEKMHGRFACKNNECAIERTGNDES